MNELISGADYKALLPFRAGPILVDRSDERISLLIENGYLEPFQQEIKFYFVGDKPIYPDPFYTLSIKGIDALEMYEKVRKQHTDDYAEKIADIAKVEHDEISKRRFTIIVQIATAIFSVLLTLLIEHFSAIMAFIKSVFHK